VLPQRLETAVTHAAVYKLGAIAVPMSVLFGYEALLHRLGDSGAAFVVTDGERLERVASAARETGAALIGVDGPVAAPHYAFDDLVASADPRFKPVATTAETPALIIYTSGTTGSPKGALHGHRVLLGHQPGFQLSHDRFPQEGDRFWTPADWAWIGGLLNGLFSSWYHGRAIIAASRGAFDPTWATGVIEGAGARNTFLPPTALRMMRAAGSRLRPGVLRTAMSGGEALGEDTHAWARESLGVCVNEIYGQTEANYVIGNSQELWPVRPGSMGRAYPGHEVAVHDGEIVVRLPDPVAFLGYWNNRRPRRRRSQAAGCTPAIEGGSTRTATSGSRVVSTTSSRRPDTASGRRRSSIAWSVILPWLSPRQSVCPTRLAARW
jgi:acetyl-CoA synthetase